MSKLFVFAMLGISLPVAAAPDQAARVPVALRLTLTGAEASLGAKVTATISLRNYKGEAVTATERLDVAFESTLPATFESVTILPGKDSASTSIVFQRAGIAKLKATSGKLSPGYGVISVTQRRSRNDAAAAGFRVVAFREPLREAMAPRAGLKLGLKALATRVVPKNKVWTVSVLVAVLNDHHEGTRLTEDLPVRLASTLGTVVPEELTIPRGESARFVQVTSNTAGIDTISALSPGLVDKAEERVEYEQFKPAKLFLISTPSEVVTNGRSNASVTVLLRDEDDHVVALPDRDTRVVLRTTFGSLSTQATTIARGRPDSEPVMLLSPRAGHATITAVAEGLETDSEEISFVLPFLLIALAAAGGIGGAILRTPRGRRTSQLGRSLALGAFLGMIFFALAMMGVPGMIPVIPLQTLEHLTFNEVGACLLGIFGGYIGRRFLDDLLVKKSGGRREGVATA